MAKSKTKERPGVVVRFDWIRTLERMSREAQGAFLMACLKYGRDMTDPAFEGLSQVDEIRIETLWEQAQPLIDSDAQGWADGIMQKKYAGYCSRCKDRGEIPMEYSAFKFSERIKQERFNEDGIEYE